MQSQGVGERSWPPPADRPETRPLLVHRRGDRQARALLELVARRRRVPLLLLLHPTRCCAGVAEARQLAMYLMHVVLQRSYVEVGAFFGRDRTTVAHACAHIEDLRDVNQFDAVVSNLEATLSRLRRSNHATH